MQAGSSALSEPLLTVRDAAKILKVSNRTVHQLIADGQLPSVKLVRSRRIRPEDLREFIDSRLQQR